MEFEKASAKQQALVAAAVKFILELLSPFSGGLTKAGWGILMRSAYPEVERRRRESAELGRAFLDAQREKHLGTKAPVYLANYKFEWFAKAMEPAREVFQDPDHSSEDAAAQAALLVAKEVENGWRRTVIRAIQEDPANTGSDESPRRASVGWARVATGRETCGFCLALISRGPDYQSAETAGFQGSDEEAARLARRIDRGSGEDAQLASEAMARRMKQWHAGCDCRVVPVYDEDNWVGMQEAEKALQIWNKYTRLVENNTELQDPQNGNQHAKGEREWSKNEAIMNAIRKALENGDIDMRSLAAAA